MEGLTLLKRARTAGLSVSAEGDLLVIRGPRRAEGLAREMFRRKSEILAELQGRDHPESTISDLLAWASELSERTLKLTGSIEYVEAPLRKVITKQPSSNAAQYLKTIITARLYQQQFGPGNGLWTFEQWRECEEEALGALAALRQALERCGNPGNECHD